MTRYQPNVPRMPAFLADHPPAVGVVSLVEARIFDGSSVLGDATVTLDSGRIVDIGSAPPPGARIIDAGGRTVMPGLIDAHAHLAMLEHIDRYPRPAKGAEPILPGVDGHLIGRTLRDALRHGVTTIRDAGAGGDVLFELRQAIRYGAFAAPRLLLSGRLVSATAPGARFFPDMYREADGPDDVRRAVREQIRRGADFVKIMSTGARSVELEDPNPPQVTAQEMAAFVDEAHRQGLRAAAHCEGLDGTRLAIESGCDTIEHGFYLNQEPGLLAHMVEHGQTLVPTLTFLHHVAESGAWVDLLEAQGEYNLEQARATLDMARRQGVAVALGSDSPDPLGTALEMVRMGDYGLPPAEVLHASTQVAATALGIGGAVGTVAPGYLADLIVVDGDPLADLAVFGNADAIWLVMRNGAPVAGSALETGP